MAKSPTPPVAPVISTRLPSKRDPFSTAYSAVNPATGSVAASVCDTPLGMTARKRVEIATYSAQPSERMERATIFVTMGGLLPSCAVCSTTPTTSQPIGVPSGSFCDHFSSPRFIENALTRIKHSLAFGVGTSVS
ncbi:MAG: hypothetical protein KME40_26780 [Komarekiella atlantica HA4396-MV6]|nr:hypothetical protein [Komarekiella atlantica HA4396-MV6]